MWVEREGRANRKTGRDQEGKGEKTERKGEGEKQERKRIREGWYTHIPHVGER